MREAEELGARAAREFMTGGVRPRPRELAERLGIEIREVEAPPQAEPNLRAEYRGQPPQIILYRRPLNRLAEAIRAQGREDLGCEVEEVHIAHEVFHHLEFGGRFGQMRREEREAAAHAFARELCGLEFDPGEWG